MVASPEVGRDGSQFRGICQMMAKKLVALSAIASLVISTMLVFATGSTAGPGGGSAPSGAVFTTDENGTRVNQNVYDEKKDVYIDGGPGPNAPQTAAGLDDGNYYFQVTGTDG